MSEEMLDTFDIDGNFLGVKSREFCHSENPQCYHKPVWIWIKNKRGQFLVQKRAKTKKKSPGKWDMPSAGHTAAGETCLQACIRETKEELGIDTKEGDYVFLKSWLNQRGWELAQIYLLRCDVKESEMTLQKSEVECVKWLDFDEFKKLLYSDQFCNHAKEYKDWVVETLKNL